VIINREYDCMNCGQCHDCVVLTMEMAHEAEVAELRAEIAAKDAEIERLRAENRRLKEEVKDYLLMDDLNGFYDAIKPQY